jgi:hypothetical protein
MDGCNPVKYTRMPSSGMLRRVACCILQLLVTANIIPSSPILDTLVIRMIDSSEMLDKSHTA